MARVAQDFERHPSDVLSPASPLTRKLSNFAPLSAADQRVLDRFAEPEEYFLADVHIVTEGMVPRTVFLLKEGLAMRYRNLPDGGRQIMTFLIPAVSATCMCSSSRKWITRSAPSRPCAWRPFRGTASWACSAPTPASPPPCGGAPCRRRRCCGSALSRSAAAMRGGASPTCCASCCWRHAAVGLAQGKVFRLPLTQTELGDTLGLTPVHVNRVLKTFREQGLIWMNQRMLSLLNVGALQALAGFNKDHLHLGGGRALFRRA